LAQNSPRQIEDIVGPLAKRLILDRSELRFPFAKDFLDRLCGTR
jgi:hypothetical protein